MESIQWIFFFLRIEKNVLNIFFVLNQLHSDLVKNILTQKKKTSTSFFWTHLCVLLLHFLIFFEIAMIFLIRNSNLQAFNTSIAGNGVQNAFELNKNTLTLSFHKKEVGFYPGSGSLEEIGSTSGLYHTLNVPFLSGISDKSYLRIFHTVFERYWIPMYINSVFH